MNALPHLLYGSGEDAISLTLEYGAVNDTNSTNTMIDIQRRKDLCPKNGKYYYINYKKNILLLYCQYIRLCVSLHMNV